MKHPTYNEKSARSFAERPMGMDWNVFANVRPLSSDIYVRDKFNSRIEWLQTEKSHWIYEDFDLIRSHRNEIRVEEYRGILCQYFQKHLFHRKRKTTYMRKL